MANRSWIILLVEDDEDDYVLTRSLLQEARGGQFELRWVSTFAAGKEALLQQVDLHAALVDYRLGKETGLSLIRQVVSLGCQVPIILLTGQGSYSVDLEAMKAGATDYLAKDEVTAPLLERTIRYSIERHHSKLALLRAQDQLETRVLKRTEELHQANERLEDANQRLGQANQELRNEINERVRAEKALNAANAALDSERRRFFSLLDELPVFVYLQSPVDHKVRFANCRVRDRFGETCDLNCYQLFFDRADPCLDCATYKVWKERIPSEWEATLSDNRNYQMYDYPFTDIDGTQLVLKVAIDITARKQVEAELERNNRELQAVGLAERNQRQLAEALVQATTALNTSLNLDEVLDYILEQTHRVIDCSASAILLVEDKNVHIVRQRGFEHRTQARDTLETSFPVDALPMTAAMASTYAPVLGRDTQSDPNWRTAPGLEWVRSYAAVPLHVEGETIGFLIILGDEPGYFDEEVPHRLNAFAAHAVVAIHNARLYNDLEYALNQEQAMRTQLILAEKFVAMGRMVASVAHELNNPLQTIKNCLFLTQQEMAPDSPIQEYLNMAYSETQRLSNLVTQLRELYRPRSNAPHTSIGLSRVLEEVHSLLVPQLSLQNVRWQITCEIPPGANDLKVLGIGDQLKQLFINISTNAMEAMQPAGGDLTVHLAPDAEPGWIAIRFQDTGPGIPVENLTKLFEPFYTTKAAGLGLGLAICYEIVSQHGGRIEATSPPGAGAIFTIRLPHADGGK